MQVSNVEKLRLMRERRFRAGIKLNADMESLCDAFRFHRKFNESLVNRNLSRAEKAKRAFHIAFNKATGL